jgi:hypothetical protein
MPFVQPTRGDVHVNRPLTNISIAFLQSASNFVADRVFPNVPVTKQSDRYFTIDRGEFNRDDMQKRAPGAESAGGTYEIDSTPTYFCDVWALHKNIPDQIRANVDSPLAPDRETTEFLTHKALIRREASWVSNFFTTSKWTTDSAPGTKWDAASGSDPIGNVRTAKRTVLQSTGFMPNKVVVTRNVFDVLVDHADIIGRLDRGQTSGPAKTNREQLAAIFEVDEVLVMDAIKNTANKGATASHSFIGGSDGCLVVYAAPNPGLMTPTGGYTFSWTGYLGASPNGIRIKRFRTEPEASDRVEIEQAFAQKLIAADLGYFLNDVLT